MLRIALMVLAGVSTLTQTSSITPQSINLPVLTIAVDQPAYTGEPIWITALAGPNGNIRYPFHAIIEDIGCSRLEVKRNGVSLKPFPATGYANASGIVCGSAAPPDSPPHRLPLHVLFPMNEAGEYAVRWTVMSPSSYVGATGQEPDAQSEWITIHVKPASAEQREQWLQKVLANPPQDPGHLAGDFIPSVLAAAPDPRVLLTLVKYLHSEDRMVSGMAAAGLERFPPSEVRSAIVDSLVEHGPSEELAYFVSHHKGWTLNEESRVVHATIPYLQPSSSTLPSQVKESYAATQNSAAFTLLRFIFSVPNGAWPADSALETFADSKVLEAAPNVLAKSDPRTIQELAENLGSMQPSVRAHELLLRIAQRSDTAGNQARICLSWHR